MKFNDWCSGQLSKGESKFDQPAIETGIHRKV